MACGASKRFLKIGVYYLREDKILAIRKDKKQQNVAGESITIFYDSATIKSINHITEDADQCIANLCNGKFYDIEESSSKNP